MQFFFGDSCRTAKKRARYEFPISKHAIGISFVDENQDTTLHACIGFERVADSGALKTARTIDDISRGIESDKVTARIIAEQRK